MRPIGSISILQARILRNPTGVTLAKKTIGTLQERGLVKIIGKRQHKGRAWIAYNVTIDGLELINHETDDCRRQEKNAHW